MGRALAIFVSLTFLSVVFLATALGLVYRLSPEYRRRLDLRWFLFWFIKGCLIPLLLWTAMNLGVSWALQPFLPEVQAAQNSGDPWIPEFLRAVGQGAFILASFWTALTLVWMLVRTGSGLKGEERSNFKALCWTCLAGMAIPAGLILYLGGWPTLGLAGTIVAAPIAGYAPALLKPKQLPPMYARAIARIKFGKYAEAEWEIIHQLERCEDDFDGWLMLAELYATKYSDIAEAEQTILEICDQPRVTPSQLSVALHRLADWHLNIASDPDAARRALQMICSRLPGTHLAHMAQLRMKQLPETAEELHEQRQAQPIPLPALGDSLDETAPVPTSDQDRDDALEAANRCVERLKHDPNNIGAREKLARLFAERLGQPDRGLEQLTLLLNLPGQPDADRAEWMGLAAAWHIKYRQDEDAGRAMLARVILEFPRSAQAFAARRRLDLMAEARGRAQNS